MTYNVLGGTLNLTQSINQWHAIQFRGLQIADASVRGYGSAAIFTIRGCLKKLKFLRMWPIRGSYWYFRSIPPAGTTEIPVSLLNVISDHHLCLWQPVA